MFLDHFQTCHVSKADSQNLFAKNSTCLAQALPKYGPFETVYLNDFGDLHE